MLLQPTCACVSYFPIYIYIYVVANNNNDKNTFRVYLCALGEIFDKFNVFILQCSFGF